MKRDADRARAARKKFVRLEVERLESRNLPSTGVALLTDAIPNVGSLAAGPDALTAFPGPAVNTTPGSGTAVAPSGATFPLTSVPALNSLPGARDSIWLNFTGDFQAQWGSYSNITTPAFGDGSTFTSSELQIIQQTWQVVAEDYAPFNINVTTVKPSNLGHGFTQQVDIGGNGSWDGGDYGGLTYVGSFADPSLPNTSYVFSDNLYNDPIYMGDAISHEAGHGFGLVHQSVWNANGTLAQEYNPGNAAEAPIMGYPYTATRAVWWDGVSEQGPNVIQDDMAVIASAVNGFGYRPEPSNTSAAAATPLTVSGGQLSGAGVIIHTTDKDFFSFTTGAGQISLSVNVAYGNNLAPTIGLLGSNGQTVLASDDPSPNFKATITTTVAAGTYYVEIGSHGNYDDDGQYTISGTVVTGQSDPGMPTGLTASAGTGRVNLAWNAVSGATSYDIYRGTSTGVETLVHSGVAGTSYIDTGLSIGTTYYYQVAAANSVGEGGRSTEAHATPYPSLGGSQGIGIDTGGGGVGNFVADTYFTGGSTYSSSNSIKTNGVSHAPPESIYQSERYGNFAYTVSKLNPGAGYSVRLDFAEIYWNAAGQRLFNVTINGLQVLTNFDIFATAGGKNIAVTESFTTPANAAGQVVIAFTSIKNNAKVSGIEIAPISAAPSTSTLLGNSPNARYVENLYALLLHRSADAGATSWVQLLNQGASPVGIVQDIEDSPEYLSDVVAALYQHYLKRTPDAGASGWVTALQNGATIEQVIEGIVGSAEFYQNEGGGTASGFVAALYSYLLDRVPEAAGEAGWLQALTGGLSRSAIAGAFVTSTEYRTKLLDAYYSTYLGRDVDAGGLAAWLAVFQSGATDQEVLSDIIGSPEARGKWS